MENLKAFFFVVSSFFLASNAAIHSYGDGFTPQANSRYFIGGSEGLRTPASIRFGDVTFLRTLESARKQNATGLVEAVVFERADRDRIGATLLRSNAVCCTPEFSATGVCIPGEVIIKRDGGDLHWPKRIKTYFHGNETEAKMSREEVVVNKTGLYFVYFFICDPQLDGTTITGRTVWKNRSGYLPGKVAPMLNVFGIVSLLYLFLGILWFLRILQSGKQMAQLQHLITMLIALGMFETAVHYYEYAEFNKTGTRPTEVTVWAVTFSSVSKTLSRLLLLLVSMGYGVLKPTLDGFTPRMLILGGVGNMAELALFRKFTSALCIFVLLSVAWSGFELYLDAADPLSEQWETEWIVPAFWSVHAYGVLAVLCILWDPSNNPERVSYSEVSEIEMS